MPTASGDPAGNLVLVEDGVSREPIVIYKDAPLLTRETADNVTMINVANICFTPFKVHEVKVYVKRLSSGLDEDEAEVQ